MTSCPFDVGDRIRQRGPTVVVGGEPPVRLPSVWPEATVVEVLDDRFRYRYDAPFVLHARLGLIASGGECLETGYTGFERVEPELASKRV